MGGCDNIHQQSKKGKNKARMPTSSTCFRFVARQEKKRQRTHSELKRIRKNDQQMTMATVWNRSLLLLLLVFLVGITVSQAKPLGTSRTLPQKKVLSRYRRDRVRGDAPTKQNRKLQKVMSTEEATSYDNDDDDDDNYGSGFSHDAKGSKTNKETKTSTSTIKSSGGKGKGKSSSKKTKKSTAAPKSQKGKGGKKSQSMKSHSKSGNIFEHPEGEEEIERTSLKWPIEKIPRVDPDKNRIWKKEEI